MNAGFDPGTNAAKIAVFADGIEVPILVNVAGSKFDVNDTIEFYGLPIDTTGTGGHVYYVTTTKGSGLRLKSSTATGGATAPASLQLHVQPHRADALLLRADQQRRPRQLVRRLRQHRSGFGDADDEQHPAPAMRRCTSSCRAPPTTTITSPP